MADTVLRLELQMPNGRVVQLDVNLNAPDKRRQLADALERAGDPAAAELVRQAEDE